ncbi:MAG: phosphotransferase family protein, partial [Alphaproteobacteria bacterium]|nr:phosphotransferase family protein [Alphaproteobacteria bacterium]
MADVNNTEDIQALEGYLEAHVSRFSGLVKVEKFGTGQSNPTYHLTANSGEYVLRAKPAGTLLKSAHQVDREFKVMDALNHSDVPVPKMLHLAGEDNPLGRMFFVMSYLEGRIFWDPSLPELAKSARAPIYDAMNKTLAALHNVDVAAVGLVDFGRQGNYFARQTDRWIKQYNASKMEASEHMERLMAWLLDQMPDDETATLVHGDYRLDNMIFAQDSAEVIAVLDWELSTLGPPLADLA